MSSQTAMSKRIAQNTLFLYMRMLILMIISLYTSRVVLKALGVEDFGIYNVVGGIVAMFSIISGSLSASITRFLNFEMGRGVPERLNAIFSSSVTIQLILAAIVVLIAETLGLWFLNSKILIPATRMIAANWVFQLSILTFVINLVSVPYNATIIAHERMSAFAYIGIYEGVAKLFIAFLITRTPIDHLIAYAILMCMVSLSVRLIYGRYCSKNFDECRFKFALDRDVLSQMFAFAGWNFIGAIAGVLRDQGGNIILNMFCGPVVNAARGISNQVNNAVAGFVTNFTMALNPQITQSYSSGRTDYMKSLMYQGSKLSYYLLLVLSLPIIINTSYILDVWLGEYPEHTTMFIRLTLVLSMWESLASPMSTGLLATGNIKWYQICVGGLNLINLPISYVFLKMGYAPESVLVVSIIVSQMALFLRLFFVKILLGFRVIDFVINVYLRLIIVTLLSIICPVLLNMHLNGTFISFILNSIVCVFLTLVVIYTCGCSSNERQLVRNYMMKTIKKIKR